MSMMSVRTERLSSIIDEVKAIADDLDLIDLRFFDKFIDPKKATISNEGERKRTR
jgi:hypothetical protein